MNKNSLIVLLVCLALSACHQEDAGPMQTDSRAFSVSDFDRIEVTDAIEVTIVKGSLFAIQADGDRRNLDDLRVTLHGTTLNIQYSVSRNRQYTTHVAITMPLIQGIKLSGASIGRTTGFIDTVARIDVSLSGAAIGNFELAANTLSMNVSGASQADVAGGGNTIDATISGASTLGAFNFPVESARIVASGASHARVKSSATLTVNASGASEVRYRGEPHVDASVSGASWVGKD